MAKMKNKVILITGAAGGIGSATARRFVEQGAKVVLADVDTTALAEEQAGLQAAAKAGVEAMANALRVEVADQGVTVGVLHPGWINTSLVTKKIDDHPAFNVYMESLPKPLAQLSDVEELAEVLAKGIAKRKAKVIYPRLGWGLHAIRALLPTPLLSAGQRKAAPRMREEFRKNPR